MLVQRANPSGVYLRGQTYCFRWVVPAEFRPYLGVREIKRSLHTTSKRVALARAHWLIELVEGLTQLKHEYQSGLKSKADLISSIQATRAAINEKNNNSKLSPPKLWHEAIINFVALRASDGLSTRMAKEYKRNVDAICALSENIPVNCVDSAFLRELLAVYAKLPKRNISPYHGLPFEELLKMDIPEKARVSPKTVSHLLKFLQGFFVYARQNGLVCDTPAKNLNLRLDLSSRYGVFSDKDIRKILDFVDAYDNWKKWAIYLAIYTGARRGEIAQLRKQDIKQDEKTNIYYIQVTSEAGAVKTNNAIRKIPLHSEIIQAGFLKYVCQCNEKLFVEIKPFAISRFFKLILKYCEVESFDEDGNPKVYHSIRHTFITKARAVHSNTTAIQQVVGHASYKAGVTDRYTHQFDLSLLSDVVEAIIFSD